jgi:AcrR family transcriptional regulator
VIGCASPGREEHTTGSSRPTRGDLVPLADGGERRPARAQADTRVRILKAAKEIFFRDGFADTNLDEIAKRAEVGKGTLYRHFESKVELYVAVLAAGGAAFDEAMRAAIEQGEGARGRLLSIGRFYRRYWTERPDYFYIFSVLHLPEVIGHLSPARLAEVRGIWERPLRRLEQVIADGVRSGELRPCDPWVMANVIWQSGNSAVASLVSARRTRVIDCCPEALYDNLLDVLIRGLDGRSA